LFCNALIIFLFIHNADVKTCFLCFFFMDPIELILHRRKRAGKLLGFTVVGDAPPPGGNQITFCAEPKSRYFYLLQVYLDGVKRVLLVYYKKEKKKKK
jgi:hypothetical protein